MIRGLKVDDALVQCYMSPKKYAKTVHALIKSAAANATNNHDLDRDRLVIVEARVAPFHSRFTPGSLFSVPCFSLSFSHSPSPHRPPSHSFSFARVEASLSTSRGDTRVLFHRRTLAASGVQRRKNKKKTIKKKNNG